MWIVLVAEYFWLSIPGHTSRDHSRSLLIGGKHVTGLVRELWKVAMCHFHIRPDPASAKHSHSDMAMGEEVRPATDMWLFFLEPWSSGVCLLLKRNLAYTDCDDLSIISLVCLLPKQSAIIPERNCRGFDVWCYSAVFKVRRSGCSPS